MRNGPVKIQRYAGVALLAAVLALGACGKKSDDAAAETGAAPAPVVVGPENLAVVEETSLASGPKLSGALNAERESQVRAEVAGPVLEVEIEAGDPVKPGQVLARIDDTALRDAWLSARAQLRSAESNAQMVSRNAERTQRLSEAGAVADRDLEQARQAVESANAALADARARLVSAQKQLDKATVRAPIAGLVSERPVSVGDVVQTGTPLVTVVDPSSMRLEATVPPEQVGLLKVGTPVDFTVSGFGNRTFRGKVERVNPAVDPATRQVRLYVNIPNAGRSLVAGLFVEGRVATESRTGPAIPTAALDTRAATPSVLRVRGGRVERAPVTLGVRDDIAERVEVTGGLAVGDTVLLSSVHNLAPGTRVQVRQDKPVSAGR